jgi:hypothetical protein
MFKISIPELYGVGIARDYGLESPDSIARSAIFFSSPQHPNWF